MSKLSAIYSITNNVNGKVYIGSAVNLALRWARHKYHLRSSRHNCTPLQNAWNKYGEGAFVFTILEIVPHRAKISASQRGRTVTPETRAKISASRTGKKYPRSSAVVSLTTV